MLDSDGPVSNASRYDVPLAIILVAFLAGVIAARLGWFPTHQALVVASLLGLVAVIDALFVHPSRPPVRGQW